MFNTTNSSITSCGLISTISVENTSNRKSKLTVGGVLNKVTVRGNDKGNKIIIKNGLLKNKKKEGISMNKNLVKVLVAGAAVVGVAVVGAVVITKKVKARKARKAEEVKDENINEEVEEEVTEVETEEEETDEEVIEVEEDEEEVEETEEEDEEDETDDEDDDEVPVNVEKVVIKIAHYVGIGIGMLLGRLLLKDTIRLEEATKCL